MPTTEERLTRIEQIRTFPARLAVVVKDLTADEMTTVYLPDEWTVAQNIHHVADAHMNAFIRFKLILLENVPTLKPYDQNSWAETVDATAEDVEMSLQIIRGVHQRWTTLLAGLPDGDIWQRQANHPETGTVTLDDLLNYYSDHGDAHIEQIRKTLAAHE